jgi:hypothetical protein
MVIGVSLIAMGSGGCSSPPAGAEDDGERGQAAQHQAVAAHPGQRATADCEPQAGVAAEQFVEGDPGFKPGQGRA